jgi:hypothetical protein
VAFLGRYDSTVGNRLICIVILSIWYDMPQRVIVETDTAGDDTQALLLGCPAKRAPVERPGSTVSP